MKYYKLSQPLLSFIIGSVRVIVADINEARLELSLKMGADVIINVKNVSDLYNSF